MKRPRRSANHVEAIDWRTPNHEESYMRTLRAVDKNESDTIREFDLRDRVRGVMESGARLTQATIAKESGISAAVLSQWLSGIYAGDNAAVESRILRWLDTTQAQRANAHAMPAAPDYVATPSAERVIGALRYAQMAGDIAVIYGGAGLGKTSAIRRYAGMAPNVFVATMDPAASSVVTALEEIAECVGATGTQGGGAKLRRGIVSRLNGTHGLLIIDESQHLSTAALDQVRAIHDATGVGLALVGNEQVYARMTGGNRAAFLDRLFSRVGKKVRLTRALEEDSAKLIEAWGVSDKQSRRHLVEIASKPGGLRGLTKVMRLGSMYACAQGRSIELGDIRSAWAELGGV